MSKDRSGHDGRISSIGRRNFLAATGTATAGMVGLAGCVGGDDSEPTGDPDPVETPVDSTAVSWDELGDLEGELEIYSGRTVDQIDPLFRAIEDANPDLDLDIRYDDNNALVNQVRQEDGRGPGDLLYTQDSGALAVLKEEGLTRTLPDDIVDAIEDNYTDPDGEWMGASGRVRAIQYNTEQWDGGELPDDIFEYATDDRFEGIISTRPNSGTFRAFVVAMMEIEGENAAREWISDMVDQQDARLFESGSAQAEAVNAGEVTVGIGNQYYAGRILNENPDAPIDVAFTNNDPGCLFNVSGIAMLGSVSDEGLAAEFARYVVAKEGQEFFVETNGEYPVVDGVDYVGDLPTLDEINPPEFDLNRLGLDLQEASDLINEEGMRV